jgi:hypothetical protein
MGDSWHEYYIATFSTNPYGIIIKLPRKPKPPLKKYIIKRVTTIDSVIPDKVGIYDFLPKKRFLH